MNAEPIMKSTWVTLELAPASASRCSDMVSAPSRHTAYQDRQLQADQDDDSTSRLYWPISTSTPISAQ